MFFEGGLQNGISLAIQQGKLVACFIRDDSEETKTWQDDWLQEGEIPALLQERVVLLPIQAGSQEEGFLAAFCPIAKAPSFVVIHNGQLVENLQAGITRADFTSRMAVLLSSDSSPANNENFSSAAASASPPPSHTQPSSIPTSQVSPPVDTSSSSAPPAQSSSSNMSTRVADMLSERARKLEAEHQRQKEAEEAQRRAKAKGKQRAIEEGRDPDDELPVSKQAKDAAKKVKKQKEDEKRELQRVLASIEADKVARRAKAEAQKQAREDEKKKLAEDKAISATADTSAGDSLTQRNKSVKADAAKGERIVKLQVRLFDGSTVRSSFPSSASLNGDVRPWVDSNMTNSGAPPYNFKHILVPQPNRTIEMSEEAASLADLDLYPSATLVLVPISGYTDAYSNAGGGGVTSGVMGLAYGGISGALGLVSSGVGLAGGVLKSLTGYGQPASSSAGESANSNAGQSTRQDSGHDSSNREDSSRRDVGADANGSSIRVRTLADQRAENGERREEWYNGNQTNFQPKDDDKR